MKTWNLEEIYASVEAWQNDFKKLEEKITKVTDFKGKLGNPDTLEDYFKYDEELGRLIEKMYGYAHMKSDQNQKLLEYQDLQNRMRNALQVYMANASFIETELLAAPYEKYEKFAKDHQRIRENLFNIKRIFDSREHVLSPNEEKIISNYQLVSGSFGQLYALLQNSDASIKKVGLTDGSVVDVSVNTYTSILAGLENQEDRKRVFEAQFSYYDAHKNTLAGIYKGVVDSDLAYMRSKGYNSFLEAFLDKNKIPTDVYLSLINTVRENTKPLRRYVELRKKIFNLDEYHTYDRFLAYSKAKVEYPYEKAYSDVLEALKPMGDEFVSQAKVALADGHVDVYPQDGKRSGAYSTGIYDFGPYILLNHTNTLDSAFTLAHECGHSIHTLYSTNAQPYATKDYLIFVAEIASTLNEQLFLEYLLKNSSDKELKIQALEQQMDGIVQTFYRQTLFADFEYQAHKMAMEGKTINYESLSNIMKDLYMTYYGIDLETEALKKLVWAYIPHMYYTPFYVYQYATCFSASMQIYADIKSGKKDSKENYIKLLKAGNSTYPIEIVKMAGVDLTTKEPFEAVCKKLDELLDEFEELIK